MHFDSGWPARGGLRRGVHPLADHGASEPAAGWSEGKSGHPRAADLPKLKHSGGSFYFDFCLPCQPNLILYLGILSRNMSDTSDPGDLGSIHEHGCSDSPLAGQVMYPLLRLPPWPASQNQSAFQTCQPQESSIIKKLRICQPCQPLEG